MTDHMTAEEAQGWISEGTSHGVYINSHTLNRLARAVIALTKERDEADHRAGAMLSRVGLQRRDGIAARKSASDNYARAEAAEAKLVEFQASEKELSDAYLRLRAKLGAFDTSHGGGNRFEVTEAAIDALQAKLAKAVAGLAQIALEPMTGELVESALKRRVAVACAVLKEITE